MCMRGSTKRHATLSDLRSPAADACRLAVSDSRPPTPDPRLPALFLGIEIGGTKLQLGVGAGDGSPLVALDRHTVEPEGGAVSILARIESATAALLNRHPVKKIGIGFGGPVDSAAGRVIRSHQIEGWQDFPLAD